MAAARGACRAARQKQDGGRSVVVLWFVKRKARRLKPIRAQQSACPSPPPSPIQKTSIRTGSRTFCQGCLAFRESRPLQSDHELPYDP